MIIMQGSIRKRGSTWSWSFDLGYVNGKRKRKEKGGYRTKAECQTALREAINQYENCGSVFEASEITVSDYLDYWLKEHSLNVKYSTVEIYKTYIANYIKPAIGLYKLKSITPAILQDLINSLFKEGYRKNTLSKVLSILTASFKKAVFPYQFIKDSPAQYVTLPKYDDTNKPIRERVLTREEFQKLSAECIGTDYYVPLMIMYYTGLRLGECLGLTWDNIDFKAQTLTVNKALNSRRHNNTYFIGTPKTRTSARTIYISPALLSILRKHHKKQLEDSLFYGTFYVNQYLDSDNNITTEVPKDHKERIDFICTKEDGRVLTSSTIRTLSNTAKRLGISSFTCHNLRHTHATMLIEAGANIKDVQIRLGHSDFSTTANTYGHTTDNMKKQTVELFDRIVGNK